MDVVRRLILLLRARSLVADPAWMRPPDYPPSIEFAHTESVAAAAAGRAVDLGSAAAVEGPEK